MVNPTSMVLVVLVQELKKSRKLLFKIGKIELSDLVNQTI
jgi:hypothetical protein